MTEISPRRALILATLLEQDWLRGHVALARADNPEAVMALDLGEDLSLDSLDIIAAVVEIEDEWDFETDDAEHDGLRTVGDLVALVERKAR